MSASTVRHEENFIHSYPFADRNVGKNGADSTAHLAIWSVITSILSKEMDPQLFEAYIKPLCPVSFDLTDQELIVAAPSKFVIEKLEHSYGARLSKLLIEHTGNKQVRLTYKIDPSLGARSDNQRIVVKRISSEQSHSDLVLNNEISAAPAGASVIAPQIASNLNPRYTFSNFIVGNSNQFCNAAARQVSEEPGQTYNPLFIYGGVGLGKTHLLHAIGNAALERRPSSKVIYMSSESFTNELIRGLRTGKMDDFKKRLRECDLLLIDDIQFISGKERTQEEFFHTFNTLYSTKRQIVITSDSIPQGIDGLKERLQTRFSWGLIADLHAPDFETRVAILNRKAALDGFILPMEVAHYIAENISTNVRELEGALTRLSAICSLQGVGVSLALVESVLKPMLKTKSVNITVDDIKRVVSTHFGLKVSDLSSKKRSRSFSFPRHIAMYLCRKHTTCSYPDIGDQFGGRDHSSVIHAANVVGKKLKSEAEVRAIVDKVQEILLS